jgi:ribonuclease-3
VLTHSSWTDGPAASYERLAFLGDSVLALAVTAHLYPHTELAESGAGPLTKVRAQAVSGRSCRAVAERLGLPERLAAAAPAGARSSVESLVTVEHVVSDALEALIGAVFLTFGYERTAEAVIEAFAAEIEEALSNPVDFKSALQERLARRAQVVTYVVEEESGPPHDRTFAVAAIVEDEVLGQGSGRSKKDAEQQAAAAALDQLDGA